MAQPFILFLHNINPTFNYFRFYNHFFEKQRKKGCNQHPFPHKSNNKHNFSHTLTHTIFQNKICIILQ